MKRLLLLAGATAGVTAAIALAAPAYADNGGSDAAFLDALSGAGLTYSGPAQAVSAGKAVCQLMDGGLSPSDTVEAVHGTNPGFTMERAAQFAVISANTYCPGHI